MPFQMALDEIIFREVVGEQCPGLLRFYFSSEPWVSVGYSWRPGPGEDAGGSSAIRLCRRLTGGGRVFHGDDLIFSVAARSTEHPALKSVKLSYCKIHEAVKIGFEKAGTPVRFFDAGETLPPGSDCFRYPIATDLARGKEKVAGGAQKRSGTVLLHQESVKLPAGREPGPYMRGIRKGFEAVFGISLRSLDLDPGILERAALLARQKYEKDRKMVVPSSRSASEVRDERI